MGGSETAILFLLFFISRILFMWKGQIRSNKLLNLFVYCLYLHIWHNDGEIKFLYYFCLFISVECFCFAWQQATATILFKRKCVMLLDEYVTYVGYMPAIFKAFQIKHRSYFYAILYSIDVVAGINLYFIFGN